MKLDAAQRAARLLGIIPYVAARGGAQLQDIAERFNYPQEMLLADLVAMTGKSNEWSDEPDDPFLDAVFLDWSPVEDQICVECPSWFSDPMRLSSDEAARLLAVGQAVLSDGASSVLLDALPSVSALTRALFKLQLMLVDTKRGLNTRAKYSSYCQQLASEDASVAASVLSVTGDSIIDVELGDASKHTLESLRSAVRERVCVEIEYYAYSRDELTVRLVEPARVFSRNGVWYLSAWCHNVENLRIFRLDRIQSLTVTHRDATVDVDLENIPMLEDMRLGSEMRSSSDAMPMRGNSDEMRSNSDEMRGGSGAMPMRGKEDVNGRTVKIRVTRHARWMLDLCPVVRCQEIDRKWLEVELFVVGVAWFDRLLLRLGSEVEIVDDNEFWLTRRAAAAVNILKRYT